MASQSSARERVTSLVKVGRIAVLTIDSPPVNAINHALRLALVDAVAAFEADANATALIIACAGHTFIAGADIREFDRPPEPPHLPDVVNAIEACRKSVIAAIHGTALGGGLEIAMACHFRVALPSAEFGLPEVKLGIMPGAGGTQRLPRLIGVADALAMITSGDPIDAEKAVALGLIDRIVEGALIEGALAFASEHPGNGGTLRRTSECDEKIAAARGDHALFDGFLKANARKFSGLDAPHAIVAAVRAATNLPFGEAMASERHSFLRLREGPQAKALRHLFMAQRAAARSPDLPASAPMPAIRSVGIVGAGTMGSGIAIAFLQAGIPVTLMDLSPQGLERGVGIVTKQLERNVESGRSSREAADAALGRLRWTTSYLDLAKADLIIEAAFEELEVKRAIFADLDRVVGPAAILATNTSYLDIDTIAAATGRPDRVLGLHFFSPANIMKLLEIVEAKQTRPEVIAAALQLAKTIGKIPVVAGNAWGFIGNRMLAVRRREADKLILAGASPWDVDRVMVAFGMPMGPFQISDLAGLDLGWTRETSTGSTIRELLCEAGRRGQKSGAGFYDYDEQRRPTVAAFTEELIVKLAHDQGVKRKPIADASILDRLLLPTINEGAKIIEEGIARRASDIDVVWVHGYGWPAWRGGPLFHADRIGLPAIIERLREMQREGGEDYRPAPLLERLAAERSSFDSLDR